MITSVRLTVSLLTVACLTASAQEPPAFVSRTELVVLHVNVRDRDGGFVSGLSKDAFAVFEDRKPQVVTLFLAEETPVTSGLIIDNSISMLQNRDLVIAAGTEFAAQGRPGDEFFALIFNEHVTAVLPGHAPFTSDAKAFSGALGRAINPRGQTAFFDAMLAGLSQATRGSLQRRVLVAIADGGDNASAASFDDVVRAAQASNVMIYTVMVADPLDRESNPRRLSELARVTGGEAYRPRNRSDMVAVLGRIARDIHQTYTIGFVPTGLADGTFRPLRVIVSPPGGRRVAVRTRAGYVAGP